MADSFKSVFVTVGTTSFDRLITEVTSSDLIKILKQLGYNRLVLQYGRGKVEPSEVKSNNFEIKAFRYKDSIQEDIQKAALVISHAGAGSVMEVLEAGRPLIVIVNEELMDNHQTELAHQLAIDKHLVYGTCTELAGILQDMDVASLKPYRPGEPQQFCVFLDKLMGVS